MLEIRPLRLDFFTDRLKRRQPFAFARYGDGEMLAILGVQGRNCDGTEYTPDLGEALARTLTQPRHEDYLYAIGPKAAKGGDGLGARVAEWIAANAPGIRWHDTEVLLAASLHGELHPFVQMLARRRTVLVGGAHLAKLPLSPMAHIVTPDRDAWTFKSDIAREVLRAASMTNPQRRAEVILFSAGMVSKVLMWELYPLLCRHTSLIDTGSLWDMYCGRDSRSYARRLPQVRKLELATLNFCGIVMRFAEQGSYA